MAEAQLLQSIIKFITLPLSRAGEVEFMSDFICVPAALFMSLPPESV